MKFKTFIRVCLFWVTVVVLSAMATNAATTMESSEGPLHVEKYGKLSTILLPDVKPCDLPIQNESQFNAQVIGDATGLYTLYLGLRLLNCGDAPVNPYAVAWYKPGDPRFYWDQPDPLPVPSSVPLPPAFWSLAVALLLLAALKAKFTKKREYYR